MGHSDNHTRWRERVSQAHIFRKSDNDQFRVPGWCDRFSGRLKCQIFPRMSWKVSWIDDARSRLDYEWTLVISATKDEFIFFKVEFTIAARGKFFPTRRHVRDSAVYKGAFNRRLSSYESGDPLTQPTHSFNIQRRSVLLMGLIYIHWDCAQNMYIRRRGRD